MMGRLSHEQAQFFYSFRLDEAVPDDHPVREIAAVRGMVVLLSDKPPAHSENRWGRGRGRSIPFSDIVTTSDLSPLSRGKADLS
jgi:hypothetical protein